MRAPSGERPSRDSRVRPAARLPFGPSRARFAARARYAEVSSVASMFCPSVGHAECAASPTSTAGRRGGSREHVVEHRFRSKSRRRARRRALSLCTLGDGAVGIRRAGRDFVEKRLGVRRCSDAFPTRQRRDDGQLERVSFSFSRVRTANASTTPACSQACGGRQFFFFSFSFAPRDSDGRRRRRIRSTCSVLLEQGRACLFEEPRRQTHRLRVQPVAFRSHTRRLRFRAARAALSEPWRRRQVDATDSTTLFRECEPREPRLEVHVTQRFLNSNETLTPFKSARVSFAFAFKGRVKSRGERAERAALRRGFELRRATRAATTGNRSIDTRFFRVSCPTRYRTAPSSVVAPSRSRQRHARVAARRTASTPPRRGRVFVIFVQHADAPSESRQVQRGERAGGPAPTTSAVLWARGDAASPSERTGRLGPRGVAASGGGAHRASREPSEPRRRGETSASARRACARERATRDAESRWKRHAARGPPRGRGTGRPASRGWTVS